MSKQSEIVRFLQVLFALQTAFFILLLFTRKDKIVWKVLFVTPAAVLSRERAIIKRLRFLQLRASLKTGRKIGIYVKKIRIIHTLQLIA